MEKENKREEKVFYAHTSSHGNEPLEDHFAWLEIWRKHLELTLKVPKSQKQLETFMT